MLNPVKIGVIGCGNISKVYLENARKFDIIELIGCADINEDAAARAAEEHATSAFSVDELINHPEVELIVNLTIPAAHAAVTLQALASGKHVHCEKPLATRLEDGRKILETAKAKNLSVGCAPDTFLGGGQQTCRKMLDDGWIGRPIAGTAFFMWHGAESWHPNPKFFYEPGGGPMFDVGIYPLTAMIALLGPVKKVSAITCKGFETRVYRNAEKKLDEIPVEVPTTYAGTLQFACGAVITLNASFDVWGHKHSWMELYGTEGSMVLPNPNFFGGAPEIKRGKGEWGTVPLTHIYNDNSRLIGAVDLAYSIRTGRPARCSAELAYHVLEVMFAYEKSSESGQHIELESTCERPAALPLGLREGLLD